MKSIALAYDAGAGTLTNNTGQALRLGLNGGALQTVADGGAISGLSALPHRIAVHPVVGTSYTSSPVTDHGAVGAADSVDFGSSATRLVFWENEDTPGLWDILGGSEISVSRPGLYSVTGTGLAGP